MIKKTITKCLLLCLAVFSAASIAKTTDADIQQLGLKKLKHPQATVYTGGQPTKTQLEGLKKAGVEYVINLRPKSEQNWNEKQFVESLGLTYISIPVAGAKDVSVANADNLSKTLLSIKGKGVFVHCASGNRVGALKAIDTYQTNGNDAEVAIAVGKRWGLTRLEPLVREKLKSIK
ncbi:hypothetical protein D5018_01450 [Parashewanella curva]|uniref:DSP-PTPase phosphatase fused to NAD+ Kinase domain-containing protein n=1 Tax=Parashewanella curva TaxID=2338552 RepID=A0A3L8Q344_9GAMM|nr:hypothetical protein [Parashewanella curva]RLV61538.1 hypothetical protein D5018_01450 [Parashewanella curva]